MQRKCHYLILEKPSHTCITITNKVSFFFKCHHISSNLSGGRISHSSCHIKPQRFRLLMEPTNLLPKHIPTFQQMLHMLSIYSHTFLTSLCYCFLNYFSFRSFVVVHADEFEIPVSSSRHLNNFQGEFLCLAPISIHWAHDISVFLPSNNPVSSF